MKGGKGGRKRKGPGGGTGRTTGGRGTPMKRSANIPASAPPKKGSRKTQFGGSSSAGDELP
jgi:hypothetical protein